MSLDSLTKTPSHSPTKNAPARKPKRSFSWLLPIGLLLGFLLVLGLLFGQRLIPATSVKAAPVITIRAGETIPQADAAKPEAEPQAAGGKGQLLFQASGWIEPDPYTIYVPTLTNGVVKEVLALEGQAVKKGDLLATLIDDDARLDLQTSKQEYQSFSKKIAAHCSGFDIIEAEIAATQRNIEAMKSQVEVTSDTFKRLNSLSAGSVSQQKVVQARLANQRQIAMLAEARAKIPQLEAQRIQLTSEKDAMDAELATLETAQQRAQLALDRTRIHAPMDGIVLRLHAAPGMKRMLDMDSPTSATIVELYDPKQLQARIDVALNEAAALIPGQAVELVSDLLPDQTFTGTVTRISGQADLQRNTLQAKVEIANPDTRLRPDMLVRAKFFALQKTRQKGATTATSSERLSIFVPENALVNETLVWVLTPESKAEKRTIKLGKTTRDGHRLVLDGLLSGESVILPPHDKLEDGSRIKISNPSL